MKSKGRLQINQSRFRLFLLSLQDRQLHNGSSETGNLHKGKPRFLNGREQAHIWDSKGTPPVAAERWFGEGDSLRWVAEKMGDELLPHSLAPT